MKIIQLIWLGLIGGLVAYACVAVALVTVGGLDIGGLPPIVVIATRVLALVLMGLGLFARRKWPSLIPSDLPASERASQEQTMVIASLALIEGGGILMITTSMIAGAPAWILIGGGAAVLLMVMARP
jgi:hypothetical protein